MAIRLLAVGLACGDRGGVVVAVGADSAGVRVVGEDGAAAAQLVDQVSGVSRGSDVDCAGIVHRALVGEEDGQGGQVRQDLVFTDVSVLHSAGTWSGGDGVAVAASVGGLAVGPR